MKYLYQLIRKNPISTVLIIIIWYLSFFTPPKTRLSSISFIDKWVHIAMYAGTCSVIWIEYLARHRERINKKRLFAMAWLAPVLMSGTIELLQEYCTYGRRSGDWLDLAANAAGVTLASIFGFIIYKYKKAFKIKN